MCRPSASRDAELVDHVLDQEQTPAARLLQPRELGVEIRQSRPRRPGRRAPSSVIRTTSTPPAASTSIVDRELRAALVAVLDRVHRRLGDGRLQLLEPPGARRPSGATASRRAPSPRARCRARSSMREGEPRAPSSGARRRAAARRSVTSVMSSSCSQAGAGEALEARRAARRSDPPRPRRTRRAAASRTSRASVECASVTPSE